MKKSLTFEKVATFLLLLIVAGCSSVPKPKPIKMSSTIYFISESDAIQIGKIIRRADIQGKLKVVDSYLPDWGNLKLNLDQYVSINSKNRDVLTKKIEQTCIDCPIIAEDKEGFTLVVLRVAGITQLKKRLIHLVANDPQLREFLKQDNISIITAAGFDFGSKTENFYKHIKVNGPIHQTIWNKTAQIKLSESESPLETSSGRVITYQASVVCWDSNGGIQGIAREELDDDQVSCDKGTSTVYPHTEQ